MLKIDLSAKFPGTNQFIRLMCLLMVVLSACSRSELEYFPLEEGRYWRYQMVYQTMDGIFKGVYAVENLGLRKVDGRLLYVRQLLDGSFNYIQVNEKGVYLESVEKTINLDTNRTEAGRYIIRYPLLVGTKWEETVVSKVLIKTGPPQKTEFHIRTKVPVEMMIESMTDTVEVPAGTYTNCMRVTMKGSAFTDAGNYVGKTVVRLNETNWYAPGVGLIKSIRQESTKHRALDKGEVLFELEIAQ